MHKYTALVEIDDVDIIYNNPVIVTKNFDATKPIGVANVYHKDGKLYADIETTEDIKGFYPAIGFGRSGQINKLYTLGVCDSPNIDKRIKSIK